MLKRSAAVTITYLLGLITIVPYSVWHLLFRAPREEYALWMFVAIGWAFLFLPTVGAIVTVTGTMKALRSIDRQRSLTDLIRASGLRGDDTIALAAREVGIPRFMAKLLVRRIQRLRQDSSIPARATRN